MPEAASVTYAEVRRVARWLGVFTATDLAQALHATHEVGVRGVKALVHQKIVVDTGDTLPGEDGASESLVEYVPLPNGPREHPHETPPEVRVAQEFGGDPLRQPRGMPIGMRVRGKSSTTGVRRPGRTQGPGKKAVVAKK